MIAPLSAVGIIRYDRPTRSYTSYRDSFVRDAQVSLRAFRVGAYVLSHAVGFVQTQAQIARACGLSVTTVRAALLDLEESRHLVRLRVRDAGRWAGTAYAVSDRPFTEAELAELSPPGAESEHSESVHSESGGPKKTRSRRDTTSGKGDHASGGPVPDPTPIEDAQEEPMRRKPSTADQPLPLDLGDPPAKKPPAPSAGTVVAAYVDSYRRHHSGGDPLKRDIGRVAREAKELLTTGRADPGELERAAAAMGAGPWANLGQQLNIQRQQASKPANRGIAPPAPRGSFKAASDAQKAQFHDKIRTNPETAAWVAEDPDAVARVIAEDPTLAPVFAQLGAA